MKIVDLHTHSVFSDGKASPEVFVASLYNDKEDLKKMGLDLSTIALTDHDTMNGIEPMQRALTNYEQKMGIEDRINLLPGIELSTQYLGQELHILGYFPHTALDEIDAKIGKAVQANMEVRNQVYRSKQLRLLLDRIDKRKLMLGGESNQYIYKNLVDKLDYEFEKFKNATFSSKNSSDIINWVFPFPRNIIRKAMAAEGVAPEDVIAKYSSRTDPNGVLKKYYLDLNLKSDNYSEKDIDKFVEEDLGAFTYLKEITDNYLDAASAIELIKSVNGRAFWAHPYEFISKKGEDAFEKFVVEYLIPAGLTGLECHYPEHDKFLTEYLIKFSTANGLLISGGTDNHLKRSYEKFGVGHVNLNVLASCYDAIMD